MGCLSVGSLNAATRAALAEMLISISVIELLSCCAILHVGHLTEVLPANRRVVLRNDNESAGQAINSGKAYSAPMLKPFRVLEMVGSRLGIREAKAFFGKARIIPPRGR